MQPQKDYESEQRSLLKMILLCFVIVSTSLIVLILLKLKIEETTKAFKNSEVLVCYDTLIVSDANWRLVDNHLINNNSAGYLSIDYCKIKKD